MNSPELGPTSLIEDDSASLGFSIEDAVMDEVADVKDGARSVADVDDPTVDNQVRV